MSDPILERKRIAEILKKISRECALTRMKGYTQCDQILVEELDPNLKVYAHLMSMILIAGKSLKITFKVHYGGSEAKILAAKAYAKPHDQIALSQATDFMGEFCNLTAGKIKKTLEDQGILIGISLPLVTRGFDEVFFPKANDNTIFTDQWRFRHPETKVACSIILEILDENALKNLNPNAVSSDEEGSVDFL